VRITLDLKLQEYIHQIFPDTMKGAVVAMVPSTGEVLALYSHPTYDPNSFVGRIPAGLWGALNTDRDKPLLNRAITAIYPPASTFKTATAVMGVRLGLVNQGHAHAHPLHRGDGVRRALRALLGLARARLAGPGARHRELVQRLLLPARHPHRAEQPCHAGRYADRLRHRTGIDLPAEVKPIFPPTSSGTSAASGAEPTPSAT
jgi:penicillin-binding protein 2